MTSVFFRRDVCACVRRIRREIIASRWKGIRSGFYISWMKLYNRTRGRSPFIGIAFSRFNFCKTCRRNSLRTAYVRQYQANAEKVPDSWQYTPPFCYLYRHLYGSPENGTRTAGWYESWKRNGSESPSQEGKDSARERLLVALAFALAQAAASADTWMWKWVCLSVLYSSTFNTEKLPYIRRLSVRSAIDVPCRNVCVSSDPGEWDICTHVSDRKRFCNRYQTRCVKRPKKFSLLFCRSYIYLRATRVHSSRTRRTTHATFHDRASQFSQNLSVLLSYFYKHVEAKIACQLYFSPCSHFSRIRSTILTMKLYRKKNKEIKTEETKMEDKRQ